MKPTLQNLVASWQAFGWTKKAALQQIIDTHLRANQARGKGNKAARREAQMECAAWASHWQQMSEIDVDMLAAIYDRN